MRGRRLWIAIGVVCVVLAGAGAALAYYIVTKPVADIHNTDAPFTSSAEPTTTTPPTSSTTSTRSKDGKKKHAVSWGVPWPTYGFNAQRTRDAAELTSIHPPYATDWKVAQHAILEFPPSYANGSLYLGRDDGWVLAYRLKDGHVRWKRRFTQVIDQPAYAGGRIYFGTWDHNGGGRIIALAASNGKTIWQHQAGQPVESSMLVQNGIVYSGGNNGTVRALNAVTGKQLWTYQASGAVKCSLAYSGGRVFFGDYAGDMYALNARNGHQIWKKGTHGLAAGFESGNFYSTPAVAYGRVYIGSTDSKVYSFVANTGEIAWTETMSGWAYGSPGVSGGRVFEASYGGQVTAFGARNGTPLWTHHLPYRSLGSATVIGSLVYVADLGPGNSNGDLYAYNVGNGKLKWEFHDGKYHPVVAADGHLVVAGNSTLYVMRPLKG
jgi:outer membrane protein assembly factor BamB